MDLSKTISKVKLLIFAVSMIVVIIVWVNVYRELPGDVEANSKNIGKLTDNVNKYVVAQQTYVEVNEGWKEGQQEQRELILELIRSK